METDVCFFGKSQPTSQSYKDRRCRFLVVSESKGSKNAPKEKRQFYFYKTWNKSQEKK